MTGLIIGSAVVIAAVLGAVGWVLWGAGRLARLQRELTEWQLDEAMRKVSGGGMEAIVDATREPPPPSDGQADRLLRAVQDGEEL